MINSKSRIILYIVTFFAMFYNLSVFDRENSCIEIILGTEISIKKL